MAESTENTSLAETLEKLENLPSSDSNNEQRFYVEGCGIESTVNSASSFEAAVKFAHCLRSLNLGEEEEFIEIRDPQSNKYIYKFSAGREINVNLHRMEKNTIEESIPPNEISIAVAAAEVDSQRDIPAGAITIDQHVDQALVNYFGFPSFKPLQRETIMATLKGQNVLTVVGTGGGKTLMYMLPAVLSNKPTLVITPIKSLIQDLLQRCSELNIKACKFTGELSKIDKDNQIKDLSSFKLVFCIPEVIQDEMLQIIEEGNAFDRIVFDEAHTIITWGNSFRPVYKDVCAMLARVSCPKMLLSATIPLKVQLSLKDMFGTLCIYKNTVYRHTLTIEVTERTPKFYDEMATFIQQHREQCGIIYCVLANDVAKVHEELTKRNIQVVKYHGQLSEQLKTSSYSKWISGEVKVIVANSSFGMGIDKADVRFVLHAKTPTSVDEYFQQCGRAGRDGQLSICRLYYSYQDKTMLYKLFAKQPEVFQSQCDALNDLINILENPVHCRHKEVMCYFGEVHDNFTCLTMCDNCQTLGAHYITDGTADALKVFRAVVELTGRDITMNNLKLFVSGSRQKVMLENGLDSCSNFGVLSGQFVPPVLLDKFLHLLLFNGILKENVKQRSKSFAIYIELGPNAHDLLGLNFEIRRYNKKK